MYSFEQGTNPQVLKMLKNQSVKFQDVRMLYPGNDRQNTNYLLTNI